MIDFTAGKDTLRHREYKIKRGDENALSTSTTPVTTLLTSVPNDTRAVWLVVTQSVIVVATSRTAVFSQVNTACTSVLRS